MAPTAHDIWQQLDIEPPSWMNDGEPAEQPAAASMGDVIAANPARVTMATSVTLVSHILDFLADSDRNMIAVTAANGRLRGVVYQSDVRDALNEFGCDVFAIPLTQIMQRQPWTCAAGDDPRAVLAAMHDQGIRRAPVIADGRVVGSVSPREIIGALHPVARYDASSMVVTMIDTPENISSVSTT